MENVLSMNIKQCVLTSTRVVLHISNVNDTRLNVCENHAEEITNIDLVPLDNSHWPWSEAFCDQVVSSKKYPTQMDDVDMSGLI